MQPAFIAVRRGFDNAVANWPLLLLRVAENVALVAVIVLPLLAVVVPMVIYGAFAGFEDSIVNARSVFEAIAPHLLMVVMITLVLVLVITLAMIVHSFVEGGVVGCYVEGERAAGETETAPRSRFRVFTPELWFRHARRSWWPIFLIYNLTWGLFSLVLLIPMIAIAFFAFLLRERPEVIVLLIAGLILFIGLAILLGFIVQLWSTSAIVLRVSGRPMGAALREGWQMLFSRFLPLATLVVIAFAIQGGAAGSVGMASFGLGLVGAVPGAALAALPMQIMMSLVQVAISLAVSAWFLAAAVSVVLR